LKCKSCNENIDVNEDAPFLTCPGCGAVSLVAHPVPKPARVTESSTSDELKLTIDSRNPVGGWTIISLMIFCTAVSLWFFMHDPTMKDAGPKIHELMREESLLMLIPMLPSIMMPLAIIYFAVTLIICRKVVAVDLNSISRKTVPIPGLERPVSIPLGEIARINVDTVKGCGCKVKAILKNGKSAEIWPADTDPLMSFFIRERLSDFIEDLTVKERDKLQSDFSKAVDKGDFNTIISLLDGHPELADLRSAGGRTALTAAASGGQKMLVKNLLELGAQVNMKDRKEYRTALHYACLNGHDDAVDLLLARKADVNSTDREMATPLHLALAGGHSAIADKIASKGGRDSITYQLKGPAIPWRSLAPFLAILMPFFMFFLVSVLNINNVHMAANRGDLKKVQSLIEVNPELLNAKSAKLNETPLHEAAVMGRMDVVKYLVSKGADLTIRDGYGKTALEKAIGRGRNDVALFLISSMTREKDIAGNKPLHAAAENGNIEMVRILLDRGFDVNARDNWGETPLHNAISRDFLDIAKMLIEKGAGINAASTADGSTGKTPLHYARSDKAVRILVRKGADINAKDRKGRTPLHYAAEGSGSAVEELLASGADVNAKDGEGFTPLHYARGFRYSSKVITEHGGRE